MKAEIPILRKIADLAKKYRQTDEDLNGALNELEQVAVDRAKRFEEVGQICVGCGNKFRPFADGLPFCSLACRFDEEL